MQKNRKTDKPFLRSYIANGRANELGQIKGHFKERRGPQITFF